MPLNKRITTLRSKVDRDKSYPAQEGLQLVKETATAKFDESVDAVINLGIDAKKSDQLIRGALVLPNGTGKTTRVAVFAQGAAAEAAKAAGADIVGFDDLAEKIKGGMMDFDVVIATPDAMKVVGALGQVLGPRGLMPNPKTGTVTMDVAKAVQEVKAGKIDFKVDKTGIVHAGIGRVSFDADKIYDNAHEIVQTLIKLKPTAAKGTYIKSIHLSCTMSPAIALDPKAV